MSVVHFVRGGSRSNLRVSVDVAMAVVCFHNYVAVVLRTVEQRIKNGRMLESRREGGLDGQMRRFAGLWGCSMGIAGAYRCARQVRSHLSEDFPEGGSESNVRRIRIPMSSVEAPRGSVVADDARGPSLSQGKSRALPRQSDRQTWIR